MNEIEKRGLQRPKMVDDFAHVINSYCAENMSNTPDFILAEYLMDCLEAYEKIHAANEKWYGKELKIL